MSETKWKKKIEFPSKIEDVADSDSDTEGFEEIKEMERKLDTIRNGKRGFTKLPFLESITEPFDLAAAPTPASAADQFRSIGEAAAQQLEENQAQQEQVTSEQLEKDANENYKRISKNFIYYVKYMSKLTYNISNDVIAAKFKTIAKSVAPKEKIDKDDQKRIAQMFDRVFTGLITIFIAYNLYFVYSTPKSPSDDGSTSVFDVIDNLPTFAFPLQCALTPIKIFLLLMSYMQDGMSFVPYKSLLFFICLGISSFSLNGGLTRYFIDMFVTGIESMSSKKGWEKAVKQQNVKQDIGLILMILGCTVTRISELVMISATVIDPRAIIGWIAVFGISLLLLPLVKVVMSVIMFYMCMLIITKSKENGINFMQTMSDIDHELIGNLVFYDCNDDSSTIKQILKFLDKDLSKALFRNLYLLILGPVFLYNIQASAKVKSNIMKGLANCISFTILIALASTNEFIRETLNWILRFFASTDNE